MLFFLSLLWAPPVTVKRDAPVRVKMDPFFLQPQPLYFIRLTAAGTSTDRSLGIDHSMPGYRVVIEYTQGIPHHACTSG
jgi:hypothetical protein